jgi:hypothetical protein
VQISKSSRYESPDRTFELEDDLAALDERALESDGAKLGLWTPDEFLPAAGDPLISRAL